MEKNDPHVGERYGSWTVVARDLTKKRPMKYLCVCDCGKEKINWLCNLRAGKSTQCMDCSALSRSEHLIGKEFGDSTVIGIEKVNGKASVLIRCKCGNEKYVRPETIKRGLYKSCGKCDSPYSKGGKPIEMGKKYGMLTVIGRHKSENIFFCKCDCGTNIACKYHKFQTQNPSCGCYRKNLHIENAKKLVGMKFFRLKVVKFLGMGEDKRARYRMKCKCGTVFDQSISYIRGSQSCGCLQKEVVPKGSRNHNAKTNEVEVASIRELFQSGYYSKKDLSEMFGLSFTHICNIVANKTWKHVKVDPLK